MAAGDPIAVTVTGAAWVVTWKLPLVGLIAYKVAAAKAAAEVGHTGDPPPVAEVTDVGAVNTTRWYAERVPKPVAVTVFAESPVMTVPEAALVTKKEFADGARAYSSVEVRDAAFAGQAAGVTPEPVTAVGAGAEKVRTCPAVSVPTAADTTPFVIPVTGTAVGKVDTMKLPASGYAAYRAAPAIAAALAGQAAVPPPLSVVVLPLCEKNRSVPATSVPTGADIACVAMAVTGTLAETDIMPRVLTVTAQMVAQLVELGEIWNVFDPGEHAYVGVLIRVAASTGQPVPVIERVLPLVVKKSRVPLASVPILVAVNVGVEMPVTVYATALTTQ